MGVLVEEMLLLARLDQGRPLDRKPVDLSLLAAQAVGDARVVEPDRQLNLDVDASVQVVGDAVRLRQVLDNLLANVRTHTPAGTAASMRVVVEGDRAVVEVAACAAGEATAQPVKTLSRRVRTPRREVTRRGVRSRRTPTGVSGPAPRAVNRRASRRARSATSA